MKLAELCAGYGGLGMALELAGWPVKLAWYAENDPDAAAVMAAHHPGASNVGDVTAVDWSSCEPVDVLAAGYPCQPFSTAGLRRGMDDERWIWPDIANAVRTLRPRWVLLENVAGHLVRGASRVVADLAACGYVGSWRCVRASDVGAPHRRDRMFILAHPADADRDTVRASAVAVAGGRASAVAGDAGAGALELLPTPTFRDGVSGVTYVSTAQGSPDLRSVAALMPTPRATDGTKGGPNQHGTSGDLMLPSAVQLLPTPTAQASRHASDDRGPGTLDDFNLWSVATRADRWGDYTPAVARWATIVGRPAPDPTEAGRNGQPRLSPRFVEWLMGLPAGHVTDHVGRNSALRILGNGVVPQQGAHAIHLLTH